MLRHVINAELGMGRLIARVGKSQLTFPTIHKISTKNRHLAYNGLGKAKSKNCPEKNSSLLHPTRGILLLRFVCNLIAYSYIGK
jgi:hypothetical protein